MKLSLKHLLLLSAIALASQSSIVLAEEAAVASDAADEAAEIKVEEAVEAAVDEDDGDAAKECAADDNSCIPPEDEPAVVEDPKCPSRPHIIRCAAKYLDTDQNGALEKEELESAMGEVSWILRSLLKVIGSVDTIMKKCDADGDGKITIDHDMEATKETCLASCFKRNAFKRLFFP
ncbi:hypothetical protein ACHAXR_009734, partial [Thalassiosira sp. AJA248-18]